MKNSGRSAACLVPVVLAVLVFSSITVCAKDNVKVFKINVKEGGLYVRKTPSAKGAIIGGYYPNDKCVLVLESGKTAEGRKWSKVYHPYFGVTGWVAEEFLLASTADCSFELFLFNNRTDPNWITKYLADKIKTTQEGGGETPEVVTYTRDQIIKALKNNTQLNATFPRKGAGFDDFINCQDKNSNYEICSITDGAVSYANVITKYGDTVDVEVFGYEWYVKYTFKKSKSGYILISVTEGGA